MTGVELGALLDNLICLAATFLEYEQWEWFHRIISTLRQIYSLPLAPGQSERFDFSLHISPTAKAPRVWLQIIRRVFALGALVVRRQQWAVIRTLTLQLPDRLEYETNWLRHTVTMGFRAQQLEEQREGQTVTISLLSLAREDVARLDCLRPDGLARDDDEIITSLAQFDVLSNIVAVAPAPRCRETFYPNFARFRQTRIQRLVEQLLTR